MSSFLCFICHSTVNSDTNEEMREKYREVVGMNLCPDSHLCHICCHVLNRLWLFRCVCLKRSLEYPVLFSEKGTLNLQRNDLEIHTVCFDDCDHYKNRNTNSKYYHFTYFDGMFDCNEKYNVPNDYVELEEERQEFEEFLNNKIDHNTDNNMEIIQNEAFLTDNTKFNQCNKNVECFQENYANVGLYEAENNSNIQDLYGEQHSEDIREQYNEDDQTDNEETYTQDNENEVQIHDHHSPVNPESPIPDIIENEDQEIPQNKIHKDVKEKKRFKKLLLSVEEQKAELEGKRKEKKYTEAEFKCYNCALGFLFKDTYQAHMMRHEESNGEYQCSICSLRFATVAVARAHTGLHAERHRCRRCSAVLRRRQRADHARGCYDLRTDAASCHLCGRVFKHSNGLQQHLKRFHRSKDTGRTYSCNVCGEGFGTPAAVRAHMIKHIQRKFPCPRCASQFGSPYDLQKHFNKKHDAIGAARHAAKQLEYSAPRARARAPAGGTSHASAGGMSHACGACPARYSTRKSLLRHIRSHGTREPVRTAVCHLCGATFKGNSKLNRHLRQVCEKNKLEEELSSYYAQETGV